jgi:hypothetical protein
VLFTEYTRLPLTGFMLVYAFGSNPKKTPEARGALEFSTSTDAQLLNMNLLFTGLYSTYGAKVVVSHKVALFVEYEGTRSVAVRVVLAVPSDGFMIRKCGSFVTATGRVGHVQSAPGLLRAGN